jgi:hypothetical protein
MRTQSLAHALRPRNTYDRVVEPTAVTGLAAITVEAARCTPNRVDVDEFRHGQVARYVDRLDAARLGAQNKPESSRLSRQETSAD